jgi:S-adenosylmethionine synthetase
MLVTHETFSSEAVSSGHRDKIADKISDALLDACLAHDSAARIALERAIKGDLICLTGEITANARLDARKIARGVLRDVGHAGGAWGLYPDAMRVIEQISLQVSEIGAGVDGEDNGAGDEGAIFMPAPIALANEIRSDLHEWQIEAFPDICGPDAKTEVSLRHEDGRPVELEAVDISCQHAAHVELAEIGDLLRSALFAAAARGGLLSALLTPETQLLINPAGTFHEGVPVADAGLTGRKIIADIYGGCAKAVGRS